MSSKPKQGPKNPARFSDWDESTVRITSRVTRDGELPKPTEKGFMTALRKLMRKFDPPKKP